MNICLNVFRRTSVQLNPLKLFSRWNKINVSVSHAHVVVFILLTGKKKYIYIYKSNNEYKKIKYVSVEMQR